MANRSKTAVSFADSEITGGFWKERQDKFRAVTVNAVYDRFEETGRFEALKCQWKEGMPNKPHIFWESDVTKWIEGASYFLQKQRDPELEERIDELTARMERSQDENGYLNEYFTAVEPDARFTRRNDHELYCAGHLIEGAIAYAEATGKNRLLRVAVRYADLIDRVFRIEHSAAFDTPGHEEIELALIRLYRYTGEERYLRLAEYFINERGCSIKDREDDLMGAEHKQTHLPVRRQKTAEGHSVRALYLYSGMADLAYETGEEELAEICRTLFDNITQRRMYVTGGIGSSSRGEAFTFDYDLPEYTAYNETCASIALAMFCRRMWLLGADGIYADCAERAIYNTVLAGVSLSGDCFFYENPLSAAPKRNAFNESRPQMLKEHLPILKRVRVFDCSCCPPNLLRLVGSVGNYLYSTAGDILYIHCYMEADSRVMLNGREISLKLKTEYPYNGRVEIQIGTSGEYAAALRIPGWCHDWSLSVNGREVTEEPEKGYVTVRRSWKKGDKIELSLKMDVRLTEGNPHVIDACGRVAVQRGPLVYCAEAQDNDGRLLKDIRISRKSEYKVSMEEICGVQMPVIYMQAAARKIFNELYTDRASEPEAIWLKLIPYFAWANRKTTEMTTWFLEK